MKLTKDDVGKYYLVNDIIETRGIDTICRFMKISEYRKYYPYKMFCIKGHWEGSWDTFNEDNIKKELTPEEAMAVVL